jgi:G patch domain-containing protein 1
VKPKRPEEQIVTDEKGRKRFHGAFTGGFSAGYFNSVGSKEGKHHFFFEIRKQNTS